MDILDIKLEATPPQVPHTLSATPLLWPHTYERVELLCSSTKNQVPGFKNDWVIDILIFEGHTYQGKLKISFHEKNSSSKLWKWKIYGYLSYYIKGHTPNMAILLWRVEFLCSSTKKIKFQALKMTEL